MNAQAAPRLSLSSMKYVDDTDTGTDILSELNALSEQIIETDTSTNLTPTLADVEPNKLTTSQTLTNKQLGIINDLNKFSKSDRIASAKSTELDNRSNLVDHRFQTIATLHTATPLSSNSLSRPTSALSVQSGHSGTSSISDILAHQPLKPSYTLDSRHYRVGGPATYIVNVPSKDNSIVQSTAIGQQSKTLTSSDTTQFKYYSRPSSKQAGYITEQKIKLNNVNLTARQSLELSEDELRLSERRDLRCIDQTRCLLTLRRKAELRKRKSRFDSYALLDLGYRTDRFLLNSRNWNFNSFTLDTISNGHSLSQLLVYFFCKYNFVKIFNLDMTCVWKCFSKFSFIR